MEQLNQAEKEVLHEEGIDAQRRYNLIVSAARDCFRGTALTEEIPWTKGDVITTKEFLIKIAQYAHPKVFPNYFEHLIVTMAYAKKIAQQTGELDPHEAQSLALLHDVGRLIAPHRYLRNDLVGDLILRKAGLRREFLQKFPPLLEILGVRGHLESLDDMTKVQRITDLIDNMGKREATGELRDIPSFIGYTSIQPALYSAEGKIWPSERRGLKALADAPEGEGKRNLANELLVSEIRWLWKTYGINFDRLRAAVNQELEKPEYQEFLLVPTDAQETLDPKVDHVLQRPPITTIVFDIGNVLWTGPENKDIDLAFAEKLVDFFGCTTNHAYQTLVTSVTDDSMSGRQNELEYLQNFWRSLGKEPPATLTQLRQPFFQPDIYIPNQKMQRVVTELSKNPNIKIYCLSDAITAVTPAILMNISRYFPAIKPDNIFISNRIGASKKERGGHAFRVLLEKIGPQNTESVLFIDDKEDYTTAARANYNIRGFTFRGNPYKGLSKEERLFQELQKAGLLV